MTGFVTLIIIVLVLWLVWPWLWRQISNMMARWLQGRLMKAAGIPDPEEVMRRQKQQQKEEERRCREEQRRQQRRRREGKPIHRPRPEGEPAIPREYAEDVEYTEYKEYSSDINIKVGPDSIEYSEEEQVTDVSFTEIKDGK